MKKFSLLLASRQRVDLLKSFLRSILITAKNCEDVEVLVAIDDDDVDTHAHVNSIKNSFSRANVRFFSRPRSEWMHRDYINWVYKWSFGEFIIVLNDDTEFIEYHWDDKAYAKLKEYLSDKPDGIVLGMTSDDTGATDISCFPLVSRAGVETLGWVLPGDRKTWGADHDVYRVYNNPRVNRAISLPEIKIRHVSFHNGSRSRDVVSIEVQRIHDEAEPISMDYSSYVEKLLKNMSFNENKLLVVYNTCGISGRENVRFYLPSINNILSQKFDGFKVAVSGCMMSNLAKETLTNVFRQRVYYNWIDQTLPLNVTFNHTVRKCFEALGKFDAVLYVDSGIMFSDDYEVLQKLYSRYKSGEYAMVAAKVDNDNGYEYWSLPVRPGEDFVVPVGRALNLHCQLFGHELFDAYDQKIFPDVFAHDTSESVYTFMCAAINKKWCLAHDVSLQHYMSLDGASSGFRNKHSLLFNSPKSIEKICEEGWSVGLGYEEVRSILNHDCSWYDDAGNHRNPPVLKEFIKNNLFIPNGNSFYDSISSDFVGHIKITEVQKMHSPKVTCILVSHDKPQYVNDAVKSVLWQTCEDWELIVIDSGTLLRAGHFDWISDNRVRIIDSGENDSVRVNTAMASWCVNKVINGRLVNGYLVTYLHDDDILYPNAFDVFVNFVLENPHAFAVYASQDLMNFSEDGRGYVCGERRAQEKRGLCVSSNMGDTINCSQLCHKASAFKWMNRPEYWPEDKPSEEQSDNIFASKIGSIVPIYPIDIKVCQNRRTPASKFNR